ncbi:MAG: M23 family metallopeptidase [Candidatus Eisenbacteria bacterium]
MKGLPAGYKQLFAKIRLVMHHVGQGFSLIIAPHGSGMTVTFNLPGRVATALVILLIVFVAGIAFVGVTYTKIAFLALETSKLEAENDALREENTKITALEQEIVRVDEIRRQIEAWVGIVPGRRPAGGAASVHSVIPNGWPRRYTYAIMKPFYSQRTPYPQGMMVPALGWVSRTFLGDGISDPTHPGVDIAASVGTPVRCALDGAVKSAGWDDVYGNLIVVEHSESLSTVYGHNDKILVKEGDHVTKGQVIATIGNTGRSTAPHLHFEVLKKGDPIDPELYVRFTNN